MPTAHFHWIILRCILSYNSGYLSDKQLSNLKLSLTRTKLSQTIQDYVNFIIGRKHICSKDDSKICIEVSISKSVFGSYQGYGFYSATITISNNEHPNCDILIFLKDLKRNPSLIKSSWLNERANKELTSIVSRFFSFLKNEHTDLYNLI